MRRRDRPYQLVKADAYALQIRRLVILVTAICDWSGPTEPRCLLIEVNRSLLPRCGNFEF